jgi:hypothetical protein
VLYVDGLRYVRRTLTVMEEPGQFPQVTGSISVSNSSAAYASLWAAMSEDDELLFKGHKLWVSSIDRDHKFTCFSLRSK